MNESLLNKRLNIFGFRIKFSSFLLELSLVGFTLGFTIAAVIGVADWLYSEQEIQKEIGNPYEQSIVESPALVAEIDQPMKIAKVTAYSCVGLETLEQIEMNCPSILSGKAKTSSGTEPVAYKTAACDRANMGRVFFIDGIGKVRCTDTGGAIDGAGRFDLYVTDVNEARKWGVKQLAYRLVEDDKN